MKRALATALFVTVAAALSAQDQSAADLFHDALRIQESKGDLVRAIDMYKSLVDRFGADQTVAPKAMLEMARCYETLGRPEADGVFQQLVTKYASSPAAAVARARLAGAQKATGLIIKQVWSDVGDTVTADGKFTTATNWDTGDLAMYEFSSGKMRNITTHGKWDGSFAQGGLPSPDGKHIAYAWFDRAKNLESIRIIPRNGGTSRVVYETQSGYESLWPVGWSTDGKVLYATVDRVTSPLAVTPRTMLRKLTAFPLDGRPNQVLKQFDAQGVSQLNPTLSPNGKYFAYSRVLEPGKPERDIYLLSIDSGRETPLIEHPADDHVAAWFPSGDGILFISGRSGGRSLWSVAVRDGKTDGEPEEVRANVGAMVPRGVTKNGDFYYSVSTAESEVYIGQLLNAGSQPPRLERLPTRIQGMKRQASWSPAGDRLAYATPDSGGDRPARNSELAIYTAATKNVRVLPLTMQQFQNPVWTPDGRTLFVMGRDVDGRQGLFSVSPESGQVSAIATRGTAPATDLGRSNPQVSPDGKRLYYLWGTPGQQDQAGIAMRELATGAETRITTTRVNSFALSPDGQWFAVAQFSDRTGTATGPLSIVPVTGGPARPIGKGGPADWTVTLGWMPDSQSVLALHRTDKGLEFWLIPIDGGQPRNTGLIWKDNVNRVSVSRDGKLAVSTNRQRVETWVMQNLLVAKK